MIRRLVELIICYYEGRETGLESRSERHMRLLTVELLRHYLKFLTGGKRHGGNQ